MMKIKGSEIKKIREAARAEDNILDRNDFVKFLKICIQWRLPIRKVIELLDPKNTRRQKRWMRAAKEAGIEIQFPGVAQWAEIDPSKLNSRITRHWDAPDVVTDPGDPNADPPVEPTTRKRKWREVFMLTQIGDRYFCPMSDGMNYFDPDKAEKIEADEDVLAVIELEDLPVQDQDVGSV